MTPSLRLLEKRPTIDQISPWV